MLGQFTRKDQTNSSLNFPRSDGRLLVVAGKSGSFLREFLKDVIDETVHDTHSLAGNTDIGMNLLQDLEDVDLVSLDRLLSPLLLLVTGGGILRELLPGLWLLLCRSLSSVSPETSKFLRNPSNCPSCPSWRPTLRTSNAECMKPSTQK